MNIRWLFIPCSFLLPLPAATFWESIRDCISSLLWISRLHVDRCLGRIADLVHNR